MSKTRSIKGSIKLRRTRSRWLMMLLILIRTSFKKSRVQKYLLGNNRIDMKSLKICIRVRSLLITGIGRKCKVGVDRNRKWRGQLARRVEQSWNSWMTILESIISRSGLCRTRIKITTNWRVLKGMDRRRLRCWIDLQYYSFHSW